MATKKTEDINELTYDEFIEVVEQAKDYYDRLAGKAPYLEFLAAAKSLELYGDPSHAILQELSSSGFRDFLKNAALLPEDAWQESKTYLLPAGERTEQFTALAHKMLTRIEAIREGATDYEHIKKAFVSGPLHNESLKWYGSLKQLFAYFSEYKSYLDSALEASNITRLTEAAKENLKATKQVAGAQEKMLERSGALARSNVYYELAYGKKPVDQKYDQWDWLVLKPFRFKHGYRQTARWWLASIAAAVLGTSMLAYYLFIHMGIDFRRNAYEVLTLVAVKALILLPLFYLIRFTVHGYRVNKHLEVLYTHRWALHQTLESYLELTDREGKTSETRAQQLSQITPFFYREIETGYITKKEGLGDKSIEIIPEGVFNALNKK